MIVGIDPGFANLGVVIADKPRQIDDVVFLRVGCITTSLCKELSAAQDLVMRCDNLTHDLTYFVEEGRDWTDVYALCVEGFSRPPNASTAIKLGAANGIIGALAARWNPEVISVEQPQAIRKRVLGVKKGKTPPEEEVHAYLLEHHPELVELLAGHRKSDVPHILDAAAAVDAAFKEGRFNA